MKKEFRFLSTNGKDYIYACAWLPDGEPKAVLQLIHGVTGNIDQYEDTAEYFSKHGFLVVGADCLGHGKTAKEEDKGYFADTNGWQLVTCDCRKVYHLLREKFPNTAYFVLGNSMGSFLLRTWLIDHHDGLSGAIICATAQNQNLEEGFELAEKEIIRLGGPRNVSRRVLAFCFKGYNSQFAPNRTYMDWVTRDEAYIDSRINDEHESTEMTIGLFRDMQYGQKYIADIENVRKINKEMPMLIISGDSDAGGGNGEGPKMVYKTFVDVGCINVELKLYPGARHDLFHEINREEVLNDILSWIEKRI